MDSNRSEEQEEASASYSDDFEHDLESQDSRFSDDKVEIKVFKSAVGSLTVQPKKIAKNAQILSDMQGHGKSARTLSELSLMAMKNKPPATAGGTFGKMRNKSNPRGISFNQRSKTSLTNLGNQTMSLHRAPLAQEKVNPQDIPVSVAPSSDSIMGNRTSTSGYPRVGSNIRRVVAHTSIKEKSYASAKFKTYHNPPMLRSNLPPVKAGLAKPYTNVAQRVASAKRMTIMDLKSKIKLLQDEIEKLKKENRFLNHLQHRQDNALRKWEGKDAELPRLLNQHKDEIRSLQEQLRRAQQSAREHNEKLAVRDKKIMKLENELEKLKGLVHEEHLQDRHTLQQELDITRMNLAGAEKRIREYMRHVEILEKNHKHQLAAQERKFIKVNTHTYELQQVVANLKLALRNKDRMLNYIQMRSSGRTLIRAFHAERGDRSDDMLYGTSIQQTDLSRSYQPPSFPPLMKSHSFEFGNSPRCTSPLMDNMRDYEIFSNKRFSDDHRKIYYKGRPGLEENGESMEMRSRRPLSRLSQSLESFVRSQPSSPKNKAKTNSRSLAKPSIKEHGCKNFESHTKSASRLRNKNASQEKSPRSQVGKDPNRKMKEGSVEFEKKHEKTSHREHNKAGKPDKDMKLSTNSTSKKSKPQDGNRNAPGNPGLGSVESKELIYKGSTKGFKYEGPFVNLSSNQNADGKKDSTEFLYSPKSDKLSERSLSSTCTSHTVTSSRSEIISNIDILCARIRESCVNVPPPEEGLKKSSPTANVQSKQERDSAELMATSKQYPQPPVGPGGDTPVSSSRSNPPFMLTQVSNNTMSHQPQQPVIATHENPPLLHSIQLVAQAQVQEISSPRPHQSFASPRVHLQSMNLPSVTTSQTAQYQLATQAFPSTNYVTPIGDQIPNSPSSQSQQQQQISMMSGNQTQLLENGSIQYVSPRMSHNYATVQAASAIPDAQHGTITLHQDSQLHQQQQQHNQSPPPRVQPELSYFSFGNNGSVQEGISPNASNVTIFQTSSPYANQLLSSYPSPRVNNLTHGPFHTQQAVLLPPSARSAFTRVGYLNSGHSNNTSEQSLPSINNNSGNKNQPTYNPSYYVNLGSWK